MISTDVRYYDEFRITENLPSGYALTEIYERRNPDTWWIHYEMNAPFSYCPIHGDTRRCNKCNSFQTIYDCETGEAMKECRALYLTVTNEELAKSVQLAKEHGCEVKYY